MGFVFQAFNLVPTITAEENINLPMLLAGRKAERKWLAKIVGTLHIGDRLNQDQLITRIAHGGGGMPQYGNVMTPKQVEELVDFLLTRKESFNPNAAALGSSP